MDVWSIVLWGVVGLMVLAALLKIMLVRRNQVVVEWQAKAAAEKQNKKKTKK
jgi:hypothetical protein